MPRAAQIKPDGVVVAVSRLNGQFEHPALIWLPDSAPNVIHCQWDAQNRTFERPGIVDGDTGGVLYPALIYTLEGGA